MTTTDQDLLERAAKAYWGDEVDDVMSFYWDENEGAIVYTHADNQDHNGNDVELLWRPLEYNGDALSLETKLRINVKFQGTSDATYRVIAGDAREWVKFHDGGIEAATRRAIVRAAAAMAGEGE